MSSMVATRPSPVLETLILLLLIVSSVCAHRVLAVLDEWYPLVSRLQTLLNYEVCMWGGGIEDGPDDYTLTCPNGERPGT